MTLSLHPHLDWSGLLHDWAQSDQSPSELAHGVRQGSCRIPEYYTATFPGAS